MLRSRRTCPYSAVPVSRSRTPAAAPHGAALVSSSPSTAANFALPGPVSRRRGDPGRRLLRHHPDPHQGRRRALASDAARPAQAAAPGPPGSRRQRGGRPRGWYGRGRPPEPRSGRSPPSWRPARFGGGGGSQPPASGHADDAERPPPSWPARASAGACAAAGERPDARGSLNMRWRCSSGPAWRPSPPSPPGTVDHVAAGRPARRAPLRHPLSGVRHRVAAGARRLPGRRRDWEVDSSG